MAGSIFGSAVRDDASSSVPASVNCIPAHLHAGVQ
jgi:hypothetical protein